MKAATAFKALAALQAIVNTKEVHIPHALWSQVMCAEVALRFELDDEALQVPVEPERVAA